MWRFILVSFAFLGWSFYELSGGADYEPRTNSIQARAKLDDLRPVARPLRAQEPRVAQAPDIAEAPEIGATDTVARGLSGLNGTQTGGVTVTLAAAGASLDSEAIAHNIATRSVVTPRQQDLREVAGSRVNMRAGPSTQYDRIARLERGEQVAVLRESVNGWVKLRVVETGRVGWMAERLVTAAN
ncbi:MAG: SH3 domain-containing protein [Roseovarius sp.]|nr:SH3 domain-containing protein [Roseovarius sp.]